MIRAHMGMAALAVLLAACSSGRAPDEVGMLDSNAFEPATITVTTGTTVTWVNESAAQHTVTAYQDGLPEGASYFASGGAGNEEQARAAVSDGLIQPAGDFSVTFEEPGSYAYFCIPHETLGMTGTVVVRE